MPPDVGKVCDFPSQMFPFHLGRARLRSPCESVLQRLDQSVSTPSISRMFQADFVWARTSSSRRSGASSVRCGQYKARDGVSTTPASGASSPTASLRTVVFPAPLAPTTPDQRQGRCRQRPEKRGPADDGYANVTLWNRTNKLLMASFTTVRRQTGQRLEGWSGTCHRMERA
jgi:hypothetical protein